MSISSRPMIHDKRTFLREKETMKIDLRKARSQRVMLAGLWVLMAAVLTGCKNVDARDTSMRDPSLSSAATLQRVVDEAHAKYKDLQDGKNADYIPILATVPSELFGVVIVTKDGKIYEKGDTNFVFAIESTSKPFNAALVMKEQGPEAIKEKIGVEPTGLPFNSKMAIELYKARSVNPLVNAGAIAQVSLVQAKSEDERWKKLLGNLSDFAGAELKLMDEVFESEYETSWSNRAIAAFSPRLNEAGNSVRAQNAIKYISDELNLSIFDGR